MKNVLVYMTLIVSLRAARIPGIMNSFLILLHTGLRIGEALALEWCDLDFKHEKLRVYKTLNRVTKYYDSKGNELPERYSTIQITTPKKSASNRKVPLTDAVIAAFMSWKEKQDRDKEKLGKNWGKTNILLKKYPGLIFTTSSGRSYLPSSAQTECRRIVGIVNKHEIALAEKGEQRSEFNGCSSSYFPSYFCNKMHSIGNGCRYSKENSWTL